MNNNVQICGGGLKCDNPSCNYVDMSVSMEDYKDWVNKPCPKCGEVLLTQQDYDTAQLILRIIDVVDKSVEANEDDTQATLTFNFDGSGKVDMNIE